MAIYSFFTPSSTQIPQRDPVTISMIVMAIDVKSKKGHGLESHLGNSFNRKNPDSSILTHLPL